MTNEDNLRYIGEQINAVFARAAERLTSPELTEQVAEQCKAAELRAERAEKRIVVLQDSLCIYIMGATRLRQVEALARRFVAWGISSKDKWSDLEAEALRLGLL